MRSRPRWTRRRSATGSRRTSDCALRTDRGEVGFRGSRPFDRLASARKGRPIRRRNRENAMAKVLVPIDGSVHALRALDRVLKQIEEGRDVQVHLLNVKPPALT